MSRFRSRFTGRALILSPDSDTLYKSVIWESQSYKKSTTKAIRKFSIPCKPTYHQTGRDCYTLTLRSASLNAWSICCRRRASSTSSISIIWSRSSAMVPLAKLCLRGTNWQMKSSPSNWSLSAKWTNVTSSKSPAKSNYNQSVKTAQTLSGSKSSSEVGTSIASWWKTWQGATCSNIWPHASFSLFQQIWLVWSRFTLARRSSTYTLTGSSIETSSLRT